MPSTLGSGTAQGRPVAASKTVDFDRAARAAPLSPPSLVPKADSIGRYGAGGAGDGGGAGGAGDGGGNFSS